MRKLNPKLIFGFTLFSMIALTAVSLVFWQGVEPFLFENKFFSPAKMISHIGEKERSIDGVYISRDDKERYPIGIMIDNKYEARPWSGLSYANLVYEAPVEGGITRFLAIFSTDRQIDKIGPVRSVRPYFIDWAADIGAMLFHVGGSPEALFILANDQDMKQLDLDQYFGGTYYWRSKDRYAPHNVYTSSELLNQARKEKLTDEKVDTASWKFKDDAYESERGDTEEIKIDFSYYSFYDAFWKYDPIKNLYIRQIGQKAVQDREGGLILAKNIAVMETEILIIDSLSRRKIKTIGTGEAIIFQDGKRILATWKKPDRWDRLRFYDKNGKEIKFNRGTTWIEVVSSLDKVEG